MAGRISAAARRHRPRSVYDMLAALSFVALMLGGTAYAANTIGSGDVIDDSLRSRDIRDGTLASRDVDNGGLTGADLASGSVSGSKIANNTVTGADVDEASLLLPEGPRGNLPRGVTLRGAFRVGVGAHAVGATAQTAVSFIYTLASAPTPHFVADGATPPTECPGTVATPQAAPGHLCLYESFHSDSVGTSQSVGDPVENAAPGASRYGFMYSIQAQSTGNMASVGTWAVTSP